MINPTTDIDERLRHTLNGIVERAVGRKYTKRQIAEQAGISRKHLNLVLNGTSGCTLATAEKIARACGETIAFDTTETTR